MSRTDWTPLVAFVVKPILEQLGFRALPLQDRSPRIDTIDNDYKVEIEADRLPITLTLYSDGVWVFNDARGEVDGKMLPLHDRRWIKKMVKAGIHVGFAISAVDYFKEAKGKDW